MEVLEVTPDARLKVTPDGSNESASYVLLDAATFDMLLAQLVTI